MSSFSLLNSKYGKYRDHYKVMLLRQAWRCSSGFFTFLNQKPPYTFQNIGVPHNVYVNYVKIEKTYFVKLHKKVLQNNIKLAYKNCRLWLSRGRRGLWWRLVLLGPGGKVWMLKRNSRLPGLYLVSGKTSWRILVRFFPPGTTGVNFWCVQASWVRVWGSSPGWWAWCWWPDLLPVAQSLSGLSTPTVEGLPPSFPAIFRSCHPRWPSLVFPNLILATRAAVRPVFSLGIPLVPSFLCMNITKCLRYNAQYLSDLLGLAFQ